MSAMGILNAFAWACASSATSAFFTKRASFVILDGDIISDAELSLTTNPRFKPHTEILPNSSFADVLLRGAPLFTFVACAGGSPRTHIFGATAVAITASLGLFRLYECSELHYKEQARFNKVKETRERILRIVKDKAEGQDLSPIFMDAATFYALQRLITRMRPEDQRLINVDANSSPPKEWGIGARIWHVDDMNRTRGLFDYPNGFPLVGGDPTRCAPRCGLDIHTFFTADRE